MFEYKRFLSLLSKDLKPAACLTLLKRSSGAELKIKSDEPFDAVYVSDGEKTEKHTFNDVIALDIGFSGEIYVVGERGGELFFARDGEKFRSAGELIENFKKIQADKAANAPQEDQTFFGYDDEKIAEKNYYLLGEDDGYVKTIQNAGFKADARGKQEDDESGPCARENDALDFFCTKTDREKGRADGLNISGYNRLSREEKVDEFLSVCQKESALERIIPFGRFCRAAQDSGENIIIGKIIYRNKTYYCVGKRGKRSSAALDNKTVFFIPENGFDGENGYIMSFSFEDGRYIERADEWVF